MWFEYIIPVEGSLQSLILQNLLSPILKQTSSILLLGRSCHTTDVFLQAGNNLYARPDLTRASIADRFSVLACTILRIGSTRTWGSERFRKSLEVRDLCSAIS